MTLRSSRTRWQLLGALGLVWLRTADAEPPATVALSALQECARLTADAERLACYDRLARTGSAPAAAAGSTSNRPAETTAPSAAAAPVAPAAAAAAAASAAPAAAAPPPTTSFGSYAAEHPKPPPVANSIEAPVVALGKSAGGRTTVALAGGAVWELEDPDPLLAVGQEVTITRAALGSYILHTPSKRTHRARRLN